MLEWDKKSSCELWCDVAEQREVEQAIHTVTQAYPISIPSGRAGVLFMIDGLDTAAAQKLLRSVRQGVPPQKRRERQCA